MTIQELLITGAVTCKTENTTVAEAQLLKLTVRDFFECGQIVCITRVEAPRNAELVPVDGLAIPADATLYLHLMVQTPLGPVPIAVANGMRILRNNGPRHGVAHFLSTLIPGWNQVPGGEALIAKVEALPLAWDAPPTSFTDPSPDFTKPLPGGVGYACKMGENSLEGTTFTDQSGVTWIKAWVRSIFVLDWVKK